MTNLPWYIPDDSDEKHRNDIDSAEIRKIHKIRKIASQNISS